VRLFVAVGAGLFILIDMCASFGFHRQWWGIACSLKVIIVMDGGLSQPMFHISFCSNLFQSYAKSFGSFFLVTKKLMGREIPEQQNFTHHHHKR